MILKKYYQISIFIIFCILLNYGGKALAEFYNWPLWLDACGTVITAYVLGPVCGAIVGLTGNLIYGMQNPIAAVYGLTSIVIGLITGFAAKKKCFESLFGTLSASILVTLASVVISTPLNIIFYGGTTGNLWGDGVIEFLSEHGVIRFLCTISGEFYIDFLDKVITLVALFLLIKGWRKIRSSRKTRTSAVLITALLLATVPTQRAEAAVSGEVHFNSYVQTIYSNDSGLPCGEANDIVHTNDGILWIGTYAGLYRYNGSEFRWMGDFDSVRNVNCLFVDEEGRMWIGTNDNGLSICINENIVNVVDESSGLPSNSVRCIARSSDGYYYVGTTDAMQVLELNGGLKLLNTIPGVYYAYSISADEEGHIATVTSDGKLSILYNREVLFSRELGEEQEIYTCCAFGEDGTLYVGTSGGKIHMADISDGSFNQARTELSCGKLININKLYFDGENLFVCADNGIGYFDTHRTFNALNVKDFNNSVDSMTVDYQGNYWFASSRLGVLKLSKSPFTNIYSAIGMDSKVANSIALWQGKLYFATDTGLDVVDASGEKQEFSELTELLENVRIRCVRTDSRGHLWLCTYGRGLMEVTKDGEITYYNSTTGTFGDWARVIVELSDGRLAASSDTGIMLIGKNTGDTEEVPEMTHIRYGEGLGNAMVLCLLEPGDGSLLAGTDGDGIAVLKNDEVVRKLSRIDGLSSGVILRMVKSERTGGVYIVTSNGLCYMDTDGSIRILDNFPYFNNYDLWQRGDGKLFVLGSAGIYVVDEDALLGGGELECELLDTEKGLNSALTANSWNFCDDEGVLYLSCDSGVYKVDMQNYSSERRTYRMMVSSVTVDGVSRMVERGTPLYISRGSGKIEIFPEVINYTLEDPYVSYYLEGFDAAATVVPQSELSTITYTNLPTGEYTFRLSVLDSQRNVLEESSYTLIKEEEIYDTQWFRVYFFLVAMLAVAWLTWFIARTQIQRTLNFQRKELEFVRHQVQMGNETILAIAKAVDAKDENTSQHSHRVSDYSVMIAKKYGFSDEECENLRRAALLHDIGKIGVPDRILNKPARLTDEEYAVMKTHVTKGAEILKDFTLVDHVVEGALYHHERYDGTGYSKGLKGEEIPIYGRIIGVADAFDAMTANRVYRKKLDIDYVLNELKKGRGTQFDPRFVDILLELIDDGSIDVEALYREEPDRENAGKETAE